MNGAGPQERSKDGKRFPNASVLIVEDTPDQLDMYVLLLREHVDVIYTATGAGPALAGFVKNDDINVVIIDIGLPGKSGLWLMHQLKEYAAEGRECHIVTLTASGQYEEDARSRGAEVYLLKPVDPEVLIDTIGQVMGEQ